MPTARRASSSLGPGTAEVISLRNPYEISRGQKFGCFFWGAQSSPNVLGPKVLDPKVTNLAGDVPPCSSHSRNATRAPGTGAEQLWKLTE